MEPYYLDHDIRLICVRASTFPDGVMAAFDKLHSLLPSHEGRKIFGLSRPERSNSIVYKAAAEESYAGEAENIGCETQIVKQGNYISEYIPDFMTNLPAIGKTFRQLLTDPRLDPEGMCVEMYIGEKDVRCMVRLDPTLVNN